MKHELVFSRSSLLVSKGMLLFELILGLLTAFFGQTHIAVLMLGIFLAAGLSRLWATASCKRLEISAHARSQGVFPGEELTVEMEIKNNKFLPVVWMELFFPLAESLCLVPTDHRPCEDWEFTDLRSFGASGELVGEKKLSLLLWFETLHLKTCWQARCRGIYSTEHWRIHTGDGFGLAQMRRPFSPKEKSFLFAVYPRLVGVSPELFLRNLWNADTGARGMMEDITVIRSTRDYMPTDAARQINWRLAARGLPLSVNVYEEILPQSVHFIFDGESYRGPDPHPREMEEALSILASELVILTGRQVRCGLTLSRGANPLAVDCFSCESAEELLFSLAAWQPEPPQYDEGSSQILSIPPKFDQRSLFRVTRQVSRFYYIAYDTSCLADRTALLRLGGSRVTLLTSKEPEPFREFEAICLDRLREEGQHGA